MKVKRIIGEFPIFGSEVSQLNKQRITEAQFLNGFKDTPNYRELNQMFNIITSGLNYLYDVGIPEFTNNVAYRKGAVVTFKGNIYISFTDDNIKHVTQSSHWGKLIIESNNSKYSNTKEEVNDNNPIGTILTVPQSTNLVGYMDYIEGASYDKTLYPELYKVLGTDRFGHSISNNASDDLPIGSILHWLSVSEDVPNGWIEWKPYTSIAMYPELKIVLDRLVQRMKPSQSKQQWIDALNQDRLPIFDLDTFYLGRAGEGYSIGEWKEDTSKEQTFLTPPIVIDNSNILNPMGVKRCTHEERTHAVVTGLSGLNEKGFESSIVVVGQKSNNYVDVDKSTNLITVGDGIVTAPKTVLTRLLVKAVKNQSQNISNTHKRVIKYV